MKNKENGFLDETLNIMAETNGNGRSKGVTSCQQLFSVIQSYKVDEKDRRLLRDKKWEKAQNASVEEKRILYSGPMTTSPHVSTAVTTFIRLSCQKQALLDEIIAVEANQQEYCLQASMSRPLQAVTDDSCASSYPVMF